LELINHNFDKIKDIIYSAQSQTSSINIFINKSGL